MFVADAHCDTLYAIAIEGKRPEDYVAPPKEELEKLRYIPPEEERSMGSTASLAALLEQYMGANGDGEEKKPAKKAAAKKTTTAKKTTAAKKPAAKKTAAKKTTTKKKDES